MRLSASLSMSSLSYLALSMCLPMTGLVSIRRGPSLHALLMRFWRFLRRHSGGNAGMEEVLQRLAGANIRARVECSQQ